jgi:hypothetical protein
MNTVQENKIGSVISSIIQWLVIALLAVGVYYIFNMHFHYTPVKYFTDWQIILLSFCFAFTWVYILKIFPRIKPFNCITCMSGWFALVLGVICVGWSGIIYMPVAMTFAAIYSEVRSRWL